MTPVMVAHVISVNWDLGRGIKAITENVSSKLGSDISMIDQSKDFSDVRDELNDFGILTANRDLQKKVKYNFNNRWLPFEELLRTLGSDAFFNKDGVLEREVKIKGMNPEDYIKMVNQCSIICKKYTA